MGYAVPSNGNVLHLRDFSCITREDIEECQSLMPKYYSVVVSDTPEVKCTKIDNSVFYDNARLQAISMIDTSITEIGSHAFHNCDNLSFIELPLGLKTIGLGAFSRCDKLTQIDLPNSLEYIEAVAFAGCISLESITIPESVNAIDCDVFFGCENLRVIGVSKKLLRTYGEKHIKGTGNRGIKIVVYDEDESVEYSKVDSERNSSINENKIIVPNTEILTVEDVSKPISSKPKVETRSFNGVIRKNLMAEKRKK